MMFTLITFNQSHNLPPTFAKVLVLPRCTNKNFNWAFVPASSYAPIVQERTLKERIAKVHYFLAQKLI